MNFGIINCRPYDPGRAIFQDDALPGYVHVRRQLTYLRKCLSLSSGLHELAKTSMCGIIEQLEDYEDRGVETITVASYKKTMSVAKELQNVQIQLATLREEAAAKTARMDELSRREHELTLARLNYKR